MNEVRCPIDAQPGDIQLAFIDNALRTSFRVSSFRAEPGALVVGHEPGEDVVALLAMARRYVFIARSIDKDLVFHNAVQPQFLDDPQPALEHRGDVRPVQPGFYSLQGDFLRVFQAVNQATLRIGMEFGAIEQEHPAVWPVRLFKMIDYFHEFPHQMILCAPVSGDFAARSTFSKRYRRDADFETVPMDELMEDASYGLQPAVCDCCYYGLRGSRTHENTFYTTMNKVFRNERSPTDRLDRLTNFSVRDIMFVGQDGFVLEARQRMIDRLGRLLDALHLEAKIETANDPFFANDAAMKSVFQNAHRLKYELLARIPHLGREIAVGSINLHTDFFGKAFDIRMQDGQVAHSGCIGIGMERMSYALFCQHGPDLALWPSGVLDYLELRPVSRVALPGDER